MGKKRKKQVTLLTGDKQGGAFRTVKGREGGGNKHHGFEISRESRKRERAVLGEKRGLKRETPLKFLLSLRG